MKVLLLAAISLHAQNYIGFTDSARCDSISGWVADYKQLNKVLTLKMSIDGAEFAIQAALDRPDVGKFMGDNGIHGFNVPVPAKFRDGVEHGYKLTMGAFPLYNGAFRLKCDPVVAPPVTAPLPQLATVIDLSEVKQIRLGLGLTASVIDGRMEISIDGTTVPYRLAPDAPCADGGWSGTEEYFMVCFKGVWRKVRWE